MKKISSGEFKFERLGKIQRSKIWPKGLKTNSGAVKLKGEGRGMNLGL